MSNVFAILARKHYGDKCVPLTQVGGTENRAINLAQEIYKKGGMNRVLVVDSSFKIVFKIDRRCKCCNCQYEISGFLVCQDCKRVIPKDMYRVEEYSK